MTHIVTRLELEDRKIKSFKTTYWYSDIEAEKNVKNEIETRKLVEKNAETKEYETWNKKKIIEFHLNNNEKTVLVFLIDVIE